MKFIKKANQSTWIYECNFILCRCGHCNKITFINPSAFFGVSVNYMTI